jgi:hypothetical protein
MNEQPYAASGSIYKAESCAIDRNAPAFEGRELVAFIVLGPLAA